MTFTTLHGRIRNATRLILLALAGMQAGFAQDSPEYIQFLEERSMLFQANEQAEVISGDGVQWRQTYGDPEPGELVRTASVWLLDYPASVVAAPDRSVIATWGSAEYWDTLRNLGIELLHTNPTSRAGGIVEMEFTPTIDGGFDPISFDVEPMLGTIDEYRQMTSIAAERGGLLAGDLVPLHTGLGADFRLAERAYKDYPGMYTMVEIAPDNWTLLPEVADPWGTAHVPIPNALQLKQLGYIPGLIDSADADPESSTWSGWSATPPIVGVDGTTRRWVFLHVFKPAQPVLNWLDPSYAARRMLFGNVAFNIATLGARVMRLDAVPFLGIEPTSGDMSRLFGHPLSVAATDDLAFMIRKLGGWSFQELNLPLEEVKQYTQFGPDISYDFFTRAQVLHPLITGDATPLRLAHSVLLQQGTQAGVLMHDMQNHDEITYQLVDLGSRQSVDLDGRQINGAQLKEQMLGEMRAAVGDQAAPYNKLYRPEQDGIATTFAGFAAAALGIQDPYNATAEEVAAIQRAHLLLAHANAMIPGIFALSAWDVVGALPVPPDQLGDRTAGGDWRWINRGGVDLLGANPQATTSALGLPIAKALYGPLPQQLANPDSFASRLKQMLAARKQYRVHEAQMLAVPPVSNPAVAILVMQLPESQSLAITALNYGREPASVEVDMTLIPPGISAASIAGLTATDIVANAQAGKITDAGRLTIDIEQLAGRTLVIQR